MDKLYKKEKEKYTKIWKFPEYRMRSNECRHLSSIIKWMSTQPIKKILIIGCGEGHGIHRLKREGYEVIGLDIVDALVYPQYKKDLIIKPIWETFFKDLEFDAIIGIDILEHIPTEKIADSLKEINRISKHYYLNIALFDDKNRLTEDTLHLTIKSPSWWLRLMDKYSIIETYDGSLKYLTVTGRHSRRVIKEKK